MANNQYTADMMATEDLISNLSAPAEPTEPTYPTDPVEPTDPTYPTEPPEPSVPEYIFSIGPNGEYITTSLLDGSVEINYARDVTLSDGTFYPAGTLSYQDGEGNIAITFFEQDVVSQRVYKDSDGNTTTTNYNLEGQLTSQVYVDNEGNTTVTYGQSGFLLEAVAAFSDVIQGLQDQLKGAGVLPAGEGFQGRGAANGNGFNLSERPEVNGR